MSLLNKGFINYDEAMRQASNSADFSLKFKGVSGTSELGWKDFEKAETDGGGNSAPPAGDIERF